MASYNYDGLLIMDGPQDFENAGIAQSAKKTLITKISNKDFPRSVTASFPSGKVPTEISPQLPPGAVITEVALRFDSLTGSFGFGASIDVGIDTVDDLANPTVTSFTVVSSLGVGSILFAGQAARDNNHRPIVVPATGISNIAINSDLSTMPDFEGVLAVEFYSI